MAWTPADHLPRTALGGHSEHFIAWLGTAMVFGLASRLTALLSPQCLLLILYAVVLECGQLYTAGRHASFYDFAFSAGGVLLGNGLVYLARRCWLRSAGRAAD